MHYSQCFPVQNLLNQFYIAFLHVFNGTLGELYNQT